jgi:hypothetical protein
VKEKGKPAATQQHNLASHSVSLYLCHVCEWQVWPATIVHCCQQGWLVHPLGVLPLLFNERTVPDASAEHSKIQFYANCRDSRQHCMRSYLPFACWSSLLLCYSCHP